MKNDDFNENDFEEIEEYDDVIYDSDNENYSVEELTAEEVEETIGGGLAKPEEFASASTPIVTNRNFKYTTTEDEICLTDLTQRLGQIDKIQVINNPINAKISCNDNLISIANQGVYGLVQMEVLGHNAGETKSARAENIFVEFDSDDEEQLINMEDDFETYDEDSEYLDDLNSEEIEEAGAGKSTYYSNNSKWVNVTRKIRRGSAFVYKVQNSRYHTWESSGYNNLRKVNVTYKQGYRYVVIKKRVNSKKPVKVRLRYSVFESRRARKSIEYTFNLTFL